jgi:hypothetical protein
MFFCDCCGVEFAPGFDSSDDGVYLCDSCKISSYDGNLKDSNSFMVREIFRRLRNE